MNLKMDVSELWPSIKNKLQSKRAKVILGITIVAIAALITAAVFLISGGGSSGSDAGNLNEGEMPQGQQIETLPSTERVYDDAKLIEGGNPFQGDALDYARVSGIIINSHGKSTAIVQTPYASYIAEEGKALGGSAWIVSRIESQGVTIVSGGKTKLINIEDSSEAVIIE